jgi:nickel transport protein
VEGAYDDGLVCDNAAVEVFDPSGKRLIEGRTDADGRYAFKPPRKTDLNIVLNAGLGHRAEHTIEAAELPE